MNPNDWTDFWRCISLRGAQCILKRKTAEECRCAGKNGVDFSAKKFFQKINFLNVHLIFGRYNTGVKAVKPRQISSQISTENISPTNGGRRKIPFAAIGLRKFRKKNRSGKKFFPKMRGFQYSFNFRGLYCNRKAGKPADKKAHKSPLYISPTASGGRLMPFAACVFFFNIKQAGETCLSFRRFVLCRAKQIVGSYIENFTQLFDGLDIGFRASLLPACISVHGYFQHLGYLSLRQTPLFADNS